MQKMSKELLEILFTFIGVYISLMCHYDHRIYVRQQNICRNLVSENRFCNSKIRMTKKAHVKVKLHKANIH